MGQSDTGQPVLSLRIWRGRVGSFGVKDPNVVIKTNRWLEKLGRLSGSLIRPTHPNLRLDSGRYNFKP